MVVVVGWLSKMVQLESHHRRWIVEPDETVLGELVQLLTCTPVAACWVVQLPAAVQELVVVQSCRVHPPTLLFFVFPEPFSKSRSCQGVLPVLLPEQQTVVLRVQVEEVEGMVSLYHQEVVEEEVAVALYHLEVAEAEVAVARRLETPLASFRTRRNLYQKR